MHNLLVCCTNVPPNQREELHKRIQLMGGQVERGLTKSVTHIVAGDNKSRTKKYQVKKEGNEKLKGET